MAGSWKRDRRSDSLEARALGPVVPGGISVGAESHLPPRASRAPARQHRPIRDMATIRSYHMAWVGGSFSGDATSPLFDFSANRPAAGCRSRHSLDSLMNRALTAGSTGPAVSMRYLDSE